MRLHLRRYNSIFTIPLIGILGGIALGLVSVQSANEVNANFLKTRKRNEALQQAARISAITDHNTRNISPDVRIEETQQLGFPATASLRVQCKHKIYAYPHCIVLSHVDFHGTGRGGIPTDELLLRREFKPAVDHINSQHLNPHTSPGNGYTFYLRDCRFCLTRTEYHFISVDINRVDDGYFLWLITNVSEAAKPVQVNSRNSLFIQTGYWSFVFGLTLLQVGTTCWVAVDNLRNNKLAPLPFYAPNELVNLWEELLKYKTGLTTAESKLNEREIALKEQAIKAHESAELATAVIDNIEGALIFVKNAEGVYTLASQFMVESVGVNPVGKTDFEMPWTDKQAKQYRADDERCREQGSLAAKYELQTRGGVDYWYLSRKVLIDVNGQPSVLGVALDITELQEQRERAEVLREQAEASATASARKTTIIQAVARSTGHDMRSWVLVVIEVIEFFEEVVKGYSSYSSEDWEDIRTELINYAGEGKKALSGLESLLRGASSIYKMEGTVSLTEMTATCVMEKAQVAFKKGVQWVGFESASQKIKLDPDMFVSRVINNLIRNGLKYNERPDKKITVTYSETPEFVTFSVKDNGIGISEKKIQTLLDPLIMGIGARGTKRFDTKEDPGEGLGVFSAKLTINIHGGTLNIESEEGKGSTFIVSLPVVSGENKSDENGLSGPR